MIKLASNLNFSIQITPFSASITLKKSAQKDQNGCIIPPSPPLLFLLQNVQHENRTLSDENYKLRTTLESLNKKYENTVLENASLVDAIEEAKNTISTLTNTNKLLHIKADTASQEVERVVTKKQK